MTSFKLEAERMADPVRVIGKKSVDELDSCGGDLFRNPRDRPACRSRPFDLV